MTREQAKEIALDWYEEEVKIHGENYIFPEIGTLHDYRDAVLEDRCLIGKTINPIDRIIKLVESLYL